MTLDHPERVASLTLVASTPGGPGHVSPDLPPMSGELHIPGARLIAMEGTGHEGPPRVVWDVVIPAIVTHTEA